MRLPPLPQGARFADIYDIVMLVDNREQVGLRAAQSVAQVSCYSPLLVRCEQHPGEAEHDHHAFAMASDGITLLRLQFRHSAGGRAFAGRNEGLAHHVDQIRGRGVAAETTHLETGDAAWIARPK